MTTKRTATKRGSNVCLASFAVTLGLLLASTLSVSGNLCCIRNVQRGSCKYWGKTGFPKYAPPSCEGKVKVWTGPKQYGCNPCCAGTWQEECATCSCSKCNPLTEYESEAPTFRTDRKCSTCANLQCPTGKYRTGSCDSKTKGYACTPCSNIKCAKNQYRAGVCSGTQNDYSCNTHKPCPSNTYYVPSDDTHRTCPACPAGQHQPKTSHRSVECIPITTTSTITSTSTTTETSTTSTITSTSTTTETSTTTTLATVPRTFGGHTGGDVLCVQISDDSKYVLTGSSDTTVILWDRGSGAVIQNFTGHSGQIHSVYITSDSRHVAATSGNTAILWNVETGAIVWNRIFTVYTGQMVSVYISIELQYVMVYGSDDGTAMLLNFETGATVRTFTGGHNGGILSVTISQNFVVTASQDSKVILWNIETGEMIRTFNGHQGGVLNVFISADSRYIWSCGRDGTATLWNTDSGLAIRTFTYFTGPNANLVSGVTISHDFRYIVTSYRPNNYHGDVGAVVVIDLETGVEVWTQKGTVLSIGISVDSRFIIIGSGETTATLYEPTVTIINSNNYCKPSERGLTVEPGDGCIVLPGLQSLPGAFINSDFYTFDGDTITIAVAAVPIVHVVDGRFGVNEWNHITPAIGRYTNLYVDYIGGFLYICSDWIFNTVAPLQDDFYSLFTVVSGGGQQIWHIRVYGNNHVEVELNGTLLAEDVLYNVTGASGFDVSPMAPVQNHTIFEVEFAVLPGNFSVVLHAPGPRFPKDVLETEVVKFVGNLDRDGGGFIKTNVPPDDIPVLDDNTTTSSPDVEASVEEEDDRVPLWPLWVVLVLLCCCCPLLFFLLLCCRPRLMVLTFTGATSEVLDWERDPRMALEPEELDHLEAITLERLIEIGTQKLDDDDEDASKDANKQTKVIIDVSTSTNGNGKDVEKGVGMYDDEEGIKESIVKRGDFRRSTVLKEKDDDAEFEDEMVASYSIPVVPVVDSPGENGSSGVLPAVNDEMVKASAIAEVADGVDADIISPNHGLMAGDFIFISGVTGESAAAFNGRRRVTFVDGDVFKINANGDSAIGGGESKVQKLQVIRVEVSYKWYVWGVFDVMLSLVLQTIRRAEPECVIVSVPGKTLMLKSAVQTRMAGSPYARMKIFVKLQSGKTITLQVHPSDTIKNVKVKVQDAQDDLVPGQEQEPLFFEGLKLEDDRTLVYYNIQRDATLFETTDGNLGASSFSNPAYAPTDADYVGAELKTAVAATPEQFGGFDAEGADGYLEVGDVEESLGTLAPYGTDDDELGYVSVVDGGDAVSRVVDPDATYGAPAPVEDGPPEDAAYYQTAPGNVDGAPPLAQDDAGYLEMALVAGAGAGAGDGAGAGAGVGAGAGTGADIDGGAGTDAGGEVGNGDGNNDL